MTWPTALALIAFAATSVAMFISLNTLAVMFRASPGPRVRRLQLRRAGTMVGCWQIATGLCLGAMGQWVLAIGLFGMGGLFLLGVQLERRFGVPPWWAPEMDAHPSRQEGAGLMSDAEQGDD